MNRQRELVAKRLLLHPEEIASSNPVDEEALWNYVSAQGWKPLYKFDRGGYRALEAAAKELQDGIDPRLKAVYARGRAVLPKLRATEGGSISVQEVAKRLGITDAAVLKLYQFRRVLGFTQGGIVRFPVWQFGPGGLLHGVDKVLAMMNRQPSELDDNARMLLFLYKYGPLGGKTLLEALRVGQINAALRTAQSHLEQ